MMLKVIRAAEGRARDITQESGLSLSLSNE